MCANQDQNTCSYTESPKDPALGTLPLPKCGFEIPTNPRTLLGTLSQSCIPKNLWSVLGLAFLCENPTQEGSGGSIGGVTVPPKGSERVWETAEHVQGGLVWVGRGLLETRTTMLAC